MAKQQNNKPTGPSASLEDALEMLLTQRDKGQKLLNVRPLTSAAENTWETVTHDVLRRAFGDASTNIGRVMDVARYSHAFGNGNEQDWERDRASKMEERLQIIDGLIEMVEADLKRQSDKIVAPERRVGNKVFLVHGHDERVISEMARFLERLGLAVTILREVPSSGQTVIEKFERMSDVDFAVILLTGDDRGGTKDIPYDEQQLRARQNVILELGYFIGTLSRQRVCALCHAGVELPSDYHGVLYVAIDSAGAWKLSLCKEMKAAGLDIDMNKAV